LCDRKQIAEAGPGGTLRIRLLYENWLAAYPGPEIWLP